jgi:hypothetical protein
MTVSLIICRRKRYSQDQQIYLLFTVHARRHIWTGKRRRNLQLAVVKKKKKKFTHLKMLHVFFSLAAENCYSQEAFTRLHLYYNISLSLIAWAVVRMFVHHVSMTATIEAVDLLTASTIVLMHIKDAIDLADSKPDSQT